MDDIIKCIRRLAKNSYYQSLYSLSKEIPGLKIFKNNIDFTAIQMLFLRYLNFYSQIFMDISLGDVSNVVLDNEIYEDAYMYYKSKKDKIKTSLPSSQSPLAPTSQWIFKHISSKGNKK